MGRSILRTWVRLRRLIRERQGQTTIEYAIIFLWGVAVVFASFEALQVAIADYYYDVVSLLCLPIP